MTATQCPKKASTSVYTQENTFIICDCTSDEHIIRFVYEPTEKDLSMSVHLCDYRNVFQRMWVAIKYVLGYKSKYGHWDCVVFNNATKQQLIKLLESSELDR